MSTVESTGCAPLVTVSELHVQYGTRRDPFVAVDGVSLDIRPGETFGIVGESGSGKTTLGKSLVGLVPVHSGFAKFEGQLLSAPKHRPPRSLQRRVQMVFQDPHSSLNPRRRVGSTLTESLTIQGIGTRAEREDRAMDLLQRMGLRPEHFYRYPHEFSGGQLQRIGIARALIVSPSLIVCDEPVSALDVSIQAQILNLLSDIQDELGLSILFISHDLSVVRHIADRVVVMQCGRIVERGTTDELFANPQHPYTRQLLQAIPKPIPPQLVTVAGNDEGRSPSHGERNDS